MNAPREKQELHSAYAPTVVPVLLAGGNGSRLWPLSRKDYPKQFLKLRGEYSLVQDAALRALELPGAVTPIIVTAQRHRFLVADQLAEIGLADATVLLEPDGRDTAPATAAAVQFVHDNYGPDAVMFLSPADQVIEDCDAFVDASLWAIRGAVEEQVVTFGITPTRPESGFGYVQASPDTESPTGHSVTKFVEKPDRATAESFVRDGGYFWNGGMFMFRADTISSAFSSYEPEMMIAASNAVRSGQQDGAFLLLDEAAFRQCRSDSLDYALMEKLDNLLLVPLDAGWDDVGSFRFLDNDPPSDEHNNHTRGDVLLNEASNNLVISEHRLVAVGGVDNIMVVETEDAVLVIGRDHCQQVKGFYKRLQESDRCEARHRAQVHRPWGHYETVARGPRFQSKRILVKPGSQLSLQMHHHRAEHWIVVRGTALVTRGDEEFLLSENESTYIPLGTRHRLKNPGHMPLEIIEVQSGAYLDEDDIIRFDDVYGRVETDTTKVEQSREAEMLQREVA